MSAPAQIVRRERADASVQALQELPPLLARVFAARGVAAAEDVCHDLTGLASFEGLPDIDPATELLERALREQRRILVVGDYDADGATSTALTVSALRAFGSQNAGYLVPSRFEYGYGLTPEVVEVAEHAHAQLLVTVDNGIASIEGVKAAHAAGMQVIVTDHHLPGETLPDADAIVNPVLEHSSFPSHACAGVGVAFYLMAALRRRLREHDWFVQEGLVEPAMNQFLDLVALGTVADVVPLDRNNRILVDAGLQRMRRGQSRPGIQALLQVAGRDATRLRASDLGFAVAPRLNAAGRLDDMSLGVECLLASDPLQAAQLATRLDAMNRERRSIERDMLDQAERWLADHAPSAAQCPAALCIADDSFHQGVIGILAGRLKQRLHRPVIVLAPARDAQSGEPVYRGSGRSIGGYHLRDALARVDVRYPGLLQKFGGHAMAAGLTIGAGAVGQLREALLADAEQVLTPDQLQASILSDGELPSIDIHARQARLLAHAAPWGQGFPEPVFDGEFEVLDWRVVGEKHLKLQLLLDDGREVDAIAFNADLDAWGRGMRRVRAAYRLDLNAWKGRERLQLCIECLLPVAGTTA